METKKSLLLGALVTGVVSGLALISAQDLQAKEPGVKCMGVNSCSGSGQCHTAKNDCKGKNSCQGEGWVRMKNEKACTSKGGKVLDEKS